jgi:hypothetical protein
MQKFQQEQSILWYSFEDVLSNQTAMQAETYDKCLIERTNLHCQKE